MRSMYVRHMRGKNQETEFLGHDGIDPLLMVDEVLYRTNRGVNSAHRYGHQ